MDAGDLLGTLGAAISQLLGRLHHGDDGELSREIEIETPDGSLRAHVGLRVRAAGEGSWETYRKAGSARPREESPATPQEEEMRSLCPEILDDGMTWRMTADVPGVTRDGVTLSVEGETLVLSALGGGRRYAGRLELPPGTRANDLKVRLLQGVLEIAAPSIGARGK